MGAHEPGTASLTGFARIIGVKPSYITELKTAGRLVLTADGKRVRVEESRALIKSTSDPARAGVVARHAAARGRAAATPAPAAGMATTTGETGDDADQESARVYTDPVEESHARRRTKALADKAEADARKALRDEQIELGQLLPAEEVEHAVRGAVVTFRGALENLPNTIAPELAAISDEGRVRVVLAESLEHALDELARKFGQLARSESGA
jgi:hypothetical protein